MKERKVDVILHPIRIRIIQKFLGGEERTAKELAILLPEIAQATLYRQLDTLLKANILKVVDERKIRGTIEKVYSLNLFEASIAADDLKEATREDHLKYFMFFTTQLLDQFEAYLQQEEIDLTKDGVAYRQAALYLNDEEFNLFINELREVYQKFMAFKISPDRKKRYLSTVIIPEIIGGKTDE